jgi:hypothetical protein
MGLSIWKVKGFRDRIARQAPTADGAGLPPKTSPGRVHTLVFASGAEKPEPWATNVLPRMYLIREIGDTSADYEDVGGDECVQS